MDFELVKLEIDGEIATLTFNDPDNLNAMNQTMLDSLDLALDHVEDAENNIRCLILTGAGRGFCAGAIWRATLAKKMARQQPSARRGRRVEKFITRFCGVCETCIAPLSQPLTGHARDRHELRPDG